MKIFECTKLSDDEKIKVLSIVCAALGGIIIGFLMAPIKKGIYCGCNNGNNSNNSENRTIMEAEDKWEFEE